MWCDNHRAAAGLKRSKEGQAESDKMAASGCHEPTHGGGRRVLLAKNLVKGLPKNLPKGLAKKLGKGLRVWGGSMGDGACIAIPG